MATIDFGVVNDLKNLVKEVIRVDRMQDFANVVAAHRPELVLVMDRNDPDVLEVLDKHRGRGHQIAVWCVDQPYRIDKDINFAHHYEYIFTNELSCLPVYLERGHNANYLPLGVSRSIFYPKAVEPAFHTEVCFIGTSGSNRLTLMDQIAPYLSNKNVIISGWFWERLHNFNLLKDKIRHDKLQFPNWMNSEETLSYYNGTKICLNMHRDPDETLNSRRLPAYSMNPRTFEICASGAFQLTDIRNELPNLYTLGYEIETYSSADELVEKIEYYLTHEEQRKKIALRGYHRTIRDHTYENRLFQMLQIIFG